MKVIKYRNCPSSIWGHNFKNKPVIDLVKALVQWINNQTSESFIDPHDPIFIKKTLKNLYPIVKTQKNHIRN